MLELLKLFLEFFRIGICAFGGGLATIPFLQELAEATGWFTQEQLGNMLAISESTPGAIGVNMSTYVGYLVGMAEFNNPFMGFVGGVVATLGFVSPSVLVIIIVCQFLDKFKNSKYVKWTFYGLRAASLGLICAAAYSVLTLSIVRPDKALDCFSGITKENFFTEIWSCISNACVEFFDFKSLALAFFLGILIFKFKKHPIFYIILAAIIGIIFKF